MEIKDIVTRTALNMVVGAAYHIKIKWSDGTSFDWGYLVGGVDSTPVIIIRDVQFSAQAQITYRYVTVEITRPLTTTITIDYNDTRQQTNWVNISISERNGPQVHSDSSTLSSKTFNWAGANASLDYLVVVDIDHEFFGDLNMWKYVDYSPTFYAAPNIEALGTFGGLQTGNIISALISILCISVFSYYAGVGIGALTGISVLTMLTFWGWANYSYDFLAFSWFIVTILLLTKGR
jgi:hypothetical protein